MSYIPNFASVDHYNGMTGSEPGVVRNLVSGIWTESEQFSSDISDPMNVQPFLNVPAPQACLRITAIC